MSSNSHSIMIFLLAKTIPDYLNYKVAHQICFQ